MLKKIKYFEDGGSSDGGDGGGSSYAFSGGFGNGSDAESYNALQSQAAAENAAKAAGTYQGLGWSAPSQDTMSPIGWNANQTVYTTPSGEKLTGDLARWAAIDEWHRQNDAQDVSSAPVAQVQTDADAEQAAAEAEAQRAAEEQAAAKQQQQDMLMRNYNSMLPAYSTPSNYSQFGMPAGNEIAPQIAGSDQPVGILDSVNPKEDGGFLDKIKKYLSDKFSSPTSTIATVAPFLLPPPARTALNLGLLGYNLLSDPDKTARDTIAKTAAGSMGQLSTQALGLSGLSGMLANSAISGALRPEISSAITGLQQKDLGARLQMPNQTSTQDPGNYGLTSYYDPTVPEGSRFTDKISLTDAPGTKYLTDKDFSSLTGGLSTPAFDRLTYTPKAPIFNETYGINAEGIPLAALGQDLVPDYSLGNTGDVFSALAGRSNITAPSTYTPLADYTTGSGYGSSTAKPLYGKELNKEILKPQILAAIKAAQMQSPLGKAEGGAIPHMAAGSSTSSALDTLLNPYAGQSGNQSATKPAALAAQLLSPAGSAKVQPLGVNGFQFTPIQRFADGGHPLTNDMVETGIHSPEFMSEGGMHHYVQGGGTGTSDSVPAMLATGEFVLPADVVSGLGDGSNEAGAKILDEFMQAIRKHKRSTSPSELPPDSKGPLAYLAEAAGAKVKRGKK